MGFFLCGLGREEGRCFNEEGLVELGWGVENGDFVGVARVGGTESGEVG